MPGTSRALVIIPAYNEEAALPTTLAQLLSERPDLDVLVVDDGSRDRTAEVARAAGVPVAVLPFNLGLGGALRTGFLFAVERGYEVAIQFDADGQHDARDIAALLDAYEAGADMVLGTRFGDESGAYEVGRTRSVAMAGLRRVVRMLSGLRISDTSSGFRAFSRPLLELFAVNYPVDYLENVEALLLAHRAGFRVVEVATSMHPRAAGVASTRRLRLAFHYVRLLLILASTAQRRRIEER